MIEVTTTVRTVYTATCDICGCKSHVYTSRAALERDIPKRGWTITSASMLVVLVCTLLRRPYQHALCGVCSKGAAA